MMKNCSVAVWRNYFRILLQRLKKALKFMDLRLNSTTPKKKPILFTTYHFIFSVFVYPLFPDTVVAAILFFPTQLDRALAFILKKPLRQTVRTTGMGHQCVAITITQKKKNRKDGHYPLPMRELKHSGQIIQVFLPMIICLFCLCPK